MWNSFFPNPLFSDLRRMYERTKCSSFGIVYSCVNTTFSEISTSIIDFIYLHLIRLRTNDSIYNRCYSDIRWLRSYYCRDKVYPAPCLFSSCSKYVRYNRHQNMATPGMAIKAAIAKAAFTILPFSIETELRLKYTLCTQF